MVLRWLYWRKRGGGGIDRLVVRGVFRAVVRGVSLSKSGKPGGLIFCCAFPSGVVNYKFS